MQLLFVDESGTPPKQEDTHKEPFFVLGGIVIPEDFWHRIRDDIESLKRRFSVMGEIKWRYFSPHVPGKKPNSLSHLLESEKTAFREALFGIITKYKSVRTFGVVTDTKKTYERRYVSNADDLFWLSYKQLTERFQYYLQDISRISGQKTHGIIICDHRASRDDQRLRELHSELLSHRGQFNSSYKHLIEGVFIAPSHLSIGIQLADLVAGAFLRHCRAEDSRFLNLIEPSIRKSTSGRTEGYGIIYVPKK